MKRLLGLVCVVALALAGCDNAADATRVIRAAVSPASPPNLYHVLTGSAEAADAIRPSGYPHLDLLPAGDDLQANEVADDEQDGEG